MTALALAPPPRPLKETSPAAQGSARPLPFTCPLRMHAFASTAARVRMRPHPRNERRGLGICKPYQGTPSVLEFEFGSLQIREIWVHGRIQAHYKLIEIPESDVSWRNFGLSMPSNKCKIANFNLHAP